MKALTVLTVERKVYFHCLAIISLFLLFFGTQSVFALTYYSDRSSFDAAYPGLAIEDFEKAILGPNNVSIGFAPPLDINTNNGVFAPGDILNGVSFNTTLPPPPSEQFQVYGSGFIPGVTSKSLVDTADAPGGTALVVDFLGTGIPAAGFDFYVFLANPIHLISAPTHMSVFGSGNVLVGETTVDSSSSAPVFFGVASSSDMITRITILGEYPGYYQWEGIDNVTFNSSSSPVPEPTTLLLLGSGLIGLAGYGRKRFLKK